MPLALPVSEPPMLPPAKASDEDALAAGFSAYRERFSLVAEILEDWWDSQIAEVAALVLVAGI
jgi:hypothetical protein